jgi:hypothetical protein
MAEKVPSAQVLLGQEGLFLFSEESRNAITKHRKIGCNGTFFVIIEGKTRAGGT